MRPGPSAAVLTAARCLQGVAAALTTGVPERGWPAPAVAWGLAAAISLAGAAAFARPGRKGDLFTRGRGAASHGREKPGQARLTAGRKGPGD